MPHVVNGIGTWYYGRRNASKRVDACPHCGSVHPLWSYDTRLFFVFLFVPIVPLRRYRILDECTSGRHMSVPIASIEGDLAERAPPLESAWRAGDQGAGRELAKLLVSRERYDAAAVHVRDYLAQHPGDPEVSSLLDPIAFAEEHAVGRSKKVRLAGIAALVALGVGATLAVRQNESARVVVDNRSSTPAKLTLDGAPWLELGPDVWRKVMIPRGEHEVEAVAGGRRERFKIDVEPSIWRNVFGSQTFVVDAFRLGLYHEAEAVYGRGEAREPREHLAERFFSMASVDDLFCDPPASMKVDRGGTARRQVLSRTAVPPEEIGQRLIGVGRDGDAVDVLKGVVESGDERAYVLALLAEAGKRASRAEEVTAFLAARRTADPATVHAHRSYQQRLREEGRVAEVEREYDAFLAANPRSAMAHYLRGRLADGPTATALHERAIALDPTFPMSYGALGFQLTIDRRFDEAVDRYKAFFDRTPPAEQREAREQHWRALVLARRWGDLGRELKPALKGASARDRMRITYLEGLRRFAAGEGANPWVTWRKGAEKLFDEPQWLLLLEVARARWSADAAEAERALAALLASPAEDALKWTPRFGTALLRGDVAAAEKELEVQLGGDPRSRPFGLAVVVAIHAEWTGAKDRAAAWLARAAAGPLDPEMAAIVRYLTSDAGVEVLEPADRSYDFAERSLAALARALRAKDAATQAAELDLAARLGAYEMSEPAMMARALAARKP